MVIDNAERLGLSQLHQLRGRIGRGNKESFCALIYQSPLNKIAKEKAKKSQAVRTSTGRGSRQSFCKSKRKS